MWRVSGAGYQWSASGHGHKADRGGLHRIRWADTTNAEINTKVCTVCRVKCLPNSDITHPVAKWLLMVTSRRWADDG